MTDTVENVGSNLESNVTSTPRSHAIKSEASQFFNSKQLTSLNSLGDVIAPKREVLPSFSEVGCIAHIDVVMSSASPQDINDFGILLNAMRFMPIFMLIGVIKLGIHANRFPEFIAPLLRQLNIGVRGVIYTLYYAGKPSESFTGSQPTDVLDYHVVCAKD